MNARLSFLFVVMFSCGFGAVQPPVAWPGVKRTVTLTLTIPPETFVPIPPQPPNPPVTILAGSHVQLTTAFDPAHYQSMSVAWEKDGRPIGTALTYDIAAATAGDSGVYSAFVTVVDAQGRSQSFVPQSAAVLVTTEGQRLLNTSTRSHIDANNPVTLHGFVVEPSPTPVLLLIRAVGPSLEQFGVGDALAHPLLRLFDATGHEQDTDPTHFEPGGALPSVDEVTRRVGAFPLTPGSADVAGLYYLPSGAYTAMASAADGGVGTVLVEVYRVPLNPALF